VDFAILPPLRLQPLLAPILLAPTCQPEAVRHQPGNGRAKKSGSG
jgi:hypothetical protein